MSDYTLRQYEEDCFDEWERMNEPHGEKCLYCGEENDGDKMYCELIEGTKYDYNHWCNEDCYNEYQQELL